MSCAGYLLTEENLLCCICLDVFTDPVTLSCGHNFCKNCITHHLTFNSHCQCPLCKAPVDKKHNLGVNRFISEMAIHFRQSGNEKVSSSSETKPETETNYVPVGPKQASLKLWLLLALTLSCLTIYFANNLKLHRTLSSLNINQLFDTLEEPAENMCPEHDKPLELFCKDEQMPICRSCTDSSHRFHQVVSLKEEYEAKKTELWKMEGKLQRMIQKRQVRIQEVSHSEKLSSEGADREMAAGVQFFRALIEPLERAKAELIGMIEDKKKTKEKQAKSLIQELEQEISELTRRLAEVDKLSASEDRLHFLQSFSSLNSTLPTKAWTGISMCPALYEGIMRAAIVSAVNQLTDTVTQEMKKLQEDELQRVQLRAVDVTLDPDTAHPALILSDDGKQVRHGEVRKKLPENSKQFEPVISVLGKQSFSCGQFHYDVEVKGNRGWILGVAKQSKEKGEITLNPENGYWTLGLSNRNGYFALANSPVPLSVKRHPEKVRVFVDYEEGLVSFYDVDAAALLYSFTGCSFTEKLYPFLSPDTSGNGRNSAPLIISPVSQSVL